MRYVVQRFVNGERYEAKPNAAEDSRKGVLTNGKTNCDPWRECGDLSDTSDTSESSGNEHLETFRFDAWTTRVRAPTIGDWRQKERRT